MQVNSLNQWDQVQILDLLPEHNFKRLPPEIVRVILLTYVDHSSRLKAQLVSRYFYHQLNCIESLKNISARLGTHSLNFRNYVKAAKAEQLFNKAKDLVSSVNTLVTIDFDKKEIQPKSINNQFPHFYNFRTDYPDAKAIDAKADELIALCHCAQEIQFTHPLIEQIGSALKLFVSVSPSRPDRYRGKVLILSTLLLPPKILAGPAYISEIDPGYFWKNEDGLVHQPPQSQLAKYYNPATRFKF